MLKTQATACGSLTSNASLAPSAAAARASFRFRYFSGKSEPMQGDFAKRRFDGRSVQIVSIGFGSTATSSAPRGVRCLTEALHLARRVQPGIEANLSPGARLGYDPWLHTPRQVKGLGKATQAAGAELVAVEPNPIDTIWTDRPAPPLGKITLHGLRFAGETAKRKLARAAAALGAKDALLVSDPHAVAWVFNIRGHDVAHTPLPLGYALILKEAKPHLYVDARKLDNHTRDKLLASPILKRRNVSRAISRFLANKARKSCSISPRRQPSSPRS